MVILVKIISSEKISRELDIDEINVGDLLKTLGLSISEYVVLKNNSVVTEEDIVKNGDEVVIIPVKSGG